MASRAPQNGRGIDRRRFLSEAARSACGVGLLGLGLTGLIAKASALPADTLRPPGAGPEDDFLSACVRCGQCVTDCPYDTLRLARFTDPMATGTPYFVARQVPCEMCDDIPCVAACPTGALSKDLTDIDEAEMGIAVLVSHDTCLNFLGLRCDVCHRVCPLIDEAIYLDRQHNERTGVHARFVPTVNPDKCTGCGKCEYACVLPVAAIRVLPSDLARGKLGEHYRLGWEEKEKKGAPLIDDIIDLPDRGMENGVGQGASKGLGEGAS